MKKFVLLTLLGLCSITANLFPQGQASEVEARIDQVQAEYGLSGAGVLTVILDRGVDYRHPDFLHPDGSTRIAYVFDLYDNTGANDADNPYGIGTIYDSEEINTSLQNGGAPLINDIYGHGTATTGIMAGNGTAIADPDLYKGIAYQATIISVIVTRDFVPPFGGNPGQGSQFDPNLIPVGLQFADDKILELGMPAVTLLNIGSVGDPTDGSIGLCATIDDYVAKGHVFVCGVGDDGGADNHAMSTLATDQVTEIQIAKGEPGNLRFTAWYSEQDRFQLSIQRPNGMIEGPFAPPQDPDDQADVFLNQINIYHRGANTEFSNSSSDLRQLLIDFSGAPGTYRLIMETMQVNSDGTIHAFLNPATFYNSNRFLNHVAEGGNINSYASCFSTLTPTDYVATQNWVDINGIARSKTGEGEPGELWIGSSTGPTMDGRLGTDLAAPGEIAAAAYSLDSYYGFFPFNVLENSDGYYGIQTAVSAAAPITAGVIALMLEVNPALTPADIETILQETARSDNFTGMTPNAVWGYGKLDAYAAVTQVYATVGVADSKLRKDRVSIFPNPFSADLRITVPPDFPPVEQLKIHSLYGSCILTEPGAHIQELSLAELPPGTYFLSLETGMGTFSYRVVKM